MQLLIIDVQNSFGKHISDSLISSIPEYAAQFNQIYYLYDNINGEEYYSQIPEEWYGDDENSFTDRLNALTKNYGFFRAIMDKGIDEEEIVRLGKFLVKHNLHDVRDIADNDLTEEFKREFKNTEIVAVNFDESPMYVPADLRDAFSDFSDGIVLIGGGIDQCLKEVSLLLDIMDIKHTINHEFTY